MAGMYPVVPPPPAPAPVPPRRRTWLVPALVLAGLLVTVAVVLAVQLPKLLDDDGTGGSRSQPTARLLSCETDALGLVQVRVEVTNRSERARSYVVTVEAVAKASGNRIGSATLAEDDVAPGQVANTQGVMALSADVDAGCRIMRVESR